MGAESPKDARIRAYRALVIESAEHVFADRGFEGAHMSHIAKHAGMSVGALYGVFSGKSELFAAVIAHRLPAILEAAYGAAQSSRSALESLLRGMDAYLGFMLSHPDFLRIHLREHAWGLGPTRGGSEQLGAWRRGLDFQAQMLAQAMDEGDVQRCDPTLLARSISALHQVHLHAWIEDEARGEAEVLQHTLARLFLSFYCTEQGRSRPDARAYLEAKTP